MASDPRMMAADPLSAVCYGVESLRIGLFFFFEMGVFGGRVGGCSGAFLLSPVLSLCPALLF